MSILEKIKASKSEPKKLHVPEWECDVYLHQWSHGERLSAKSDNFSESVLLMSLRNEDGSPVFTKGDVPVLRSLKAGLFDRLVNECLALNGYTDQAVKDAEKNSEPTTN